VDNCLCNSFVVSLVFSLLFLLLLVRCSFCIFPMYLGAPYIFNDIVNYLLKKKKYNLAMFEASIVFRHGIKCAILENLSTTRRIESNPFVFEANQE
jgi:hypothetical protein